MRARYGRLLAAAALALAGATAAHAQNSTGSDALIVGAVTQPQPPDERFVFGCRGFPNCVGSFAITRRPAGCSNSLTFGGDILITGLTLGQSGTLQGRITTNPGSIDFARQSDGSCDTGADGAPQSSSFVANWNLANRNGIGTIAIGNTPVPFVFSGDVDARPPVFPMIVRSRIDTRRVTVTTDIQFRAQDLGRNGSVYAFASAPVTLVRGALATETVKLGIARGDPKADPPQCVLAQLNSAGQLVAVSLAQLQAFTTGAFAAAGNSVTILNNTPTPNVAGASVYVGYGTSAGSMLGDGIFRNAAIIPGNATCPPLPYMTSLWWNPAESGWGLNINQQGSIVFATLFTYDAARAPLWLVMSGGSLQPDGLTFLGDLYRTTGPAFNANPFTPIGASNVTQVGTMSISFTEADAATLTYTHNGVSVTKQIQRQVFGSRSANCLPTVEARGALVNYQDLWWIPSESGWGLNITHQDSTLFATLFTYDAAGRGLWLVLPSGPLQADGSYFGDLFRTAGPAFDSVPFTPIGVADITNVGTMRLRFTDGSNGTLTYTYQGASVTKAITRQVFSTPQFTCN